jgi:hypothetical protein
VEELEDRLGDRMDDILPVVKSSLTLAPGLVTTNGIHLHEQPQGLGSTEPADSGTYFEMDEEVYGHEDFVFDDMGEGVGVEGDLDMEED